VEIFLRSLNPRDFREIPACESLIINVEDMFVCNKCNDTDDDTVDKKNEEFADVFKLEGRTRD